MSHRQDLSAFLRKHPWWVAAFVALAGAVFLFGFFLAGLRVLQYTETQAFCGLCHDVMDPELTTHLVSPHANVDCGTCHVGPGAWARIYYHARNVRYVWRYPLGQYEKPLSSPLSTLRPVQVVCEQCHWPKMFYPVELVTRYDYAQDKSNSLTRTVLPLKVGSQEESPSGRGPGIHWHIDQVVTYIATDDLRQEIPWVRAEIDGQVREYQAVDSALSEQQIAGADKRRMDCIDCHNRATHIIQPPSDAMDEAMAAGEIPSDLPFIKEQGVRLLQRTYGSQQELETASASIFQFYREHYTDLYAQRRGEIQRAVEELQSIYQQTHFPFMNVYWDTYPDNIGHRLFPGCFRCHDGKHLDAEGQAIRLACNLCHAIPEVAEPGDALPAVDLAVRPTPDSHGSSLWLAQHRYAFANDCAACHSVANAGGSDNSSFCSNSACHGRTWDYIGFGAAQIQQKVAPAWPAPPTDGPPLVPHPMVDDCNTCHGLAQALPYPQDHASYEEALCDSCHRPAAQALGQPTPTAAPPVTPTPAPQNTAGPAAAAPAIPHPLEGREECLACHDPDTGRVPAPSDHKDRPQDSCRDCHVLA